jgi:3',5'-cyclic AMP phosphodiesterase CpdA
MTTLLHLSDLHFGALDDLVARALAEYLPRWSADLVVVSGDLTQRARPWQYHAAADFLSAVPQPVLAVPGNHDIPLFAFWERFISPLRRYRRYAQHRYLQNWSNEQVHVIGLTSARPFVPVVRGFWKDGAIGPRDLGHLREQIATAPGRRVIAVIHHPLLPPPVPVHGLLVNREEVAAELVRAGVSVVLSGHLHVAYSGTLDSQPGLLCVQAGSASSHRRRHDRTGTEIPNSFQRLLIGSGRVEVETHGFSGSGWGLISTARWVEQGGRFVSI